MQIEWASGGIKIIINKRVMSYNPRAALLINKVLKVGQNSIEIDTPKMNYDAVFAVFYSKVWTWEKIAKKIIKSNTQ